MFGPKSTISCHHSMITWWHGNSFRIIGETPVTGGFPTQKASYVDIWFFVVVNLNKLLKQPSSCQWFHIPWRLHDVTVITQNLNSIGWLLGIQADTFLLALSLHFLHSKSLLCFLHNLICPIICCLRYATLIFIKKCSTQIMRIQLNKELETVCVLKS